ncbi:hypothetical protein GCM10023224_17080 [Streptomonospora halophila]|uniref:DUF1772 domain-containing protein n=1 Tax=Streptomonospora halophila TaxID=427369 RepID=A0ABP9GIJ3_9ACTN
MPEIVRQAALVAAAVDTGLFAGLFTAFAYAVMPGLARAGDTAFVEAMQRINAAILNPVFAAVFAGTPVLLAAAAAVHLGADGAAAAWLGAALALVAAVIAVTMALNVPLNNALERAGHPADPDRAARARRAFEAAWVRWNVLRAALSVAALACAATALTA